MSSLPQLLSSDGGCRWRDHWGGIGVENVGIVAFKAPVFGMALVYELEFPVGVLNSPFGVLGTWCRGLGS